MINRRRSDQLHGIPLSLACRSFLLISIPIILLCSIGAAILYMVSVTSNSYILVMNSKSVLYISNSSETTSQGSILLIPQYNLEMGMLKFVIGATSFSRKDFNLLPLRPLLNAGEIVDPILPENIREAYRRVRFEALQFGYATAETCGGKTSNEIKNRSRFILSAGIIGIICSLGAIAVVAPILFSAIKSFGYSFGGEIKIIKIFKGIDVIFYFKDGQLKDYVDILVAQKRKEFIFIIILFIFLSIEIILSSIAVHLERDLRTNTLKCQRSFCETHVTAMQNLFDILPPAGYEISCKRGYSSDTLLAETILVSIALAFTFIIAGLHYYFSRKEVKVKIIKRDILGNSINPQNVTNEKNSRRVSLNNNGGLSNSFSYPGSTNTPSTTPKGVRERSIEELRSDQQLNYFNRTESEVIEANKIENELKVIYEKQIKELCIEEEKARNNLYKDKQIDFCVHLRWERKKIWQLELTKTMHQWCLDWFFGPILDLHVMETFHRQKLINLYMKKLFKKLDTKLKEIEIDKSIISAINILNLEKDEIMHIASHYNMKDNIYKYKPPTEIWLGYLDSFKNSKIKKSILKDSPSMLLYSDPSFSQVSVNVSSTDSVFDCTPESWLRDNRNTNNTNSNSNNNNNHNEEEGEKEEEEEKIMSWRTRMSVTEYFFEKKYAELIHKAKSSNIFPRCTNLSSSSSSSSSLRRYDLAPIMSNSPSRIMLSYSEMLSKASMVGKNDSITYL